MIDWTRPNGRRLLLVLAFAVTTAAAACSSSAESADVTEAPAGILKAGEEAVNDCEVAILALHDHRDFDDEFGRREQVVFDTCSWAQFKAFNEKVTERYLYPGGGRENVDYTCTLSVNLRRVVALRIIKRKRLTRRGDRGRDGDSTPCPRP